MSHAFLNGPFKASNQQCAKVGYESRRDALRKVGKHRSASHGLTAVGVGKLNVFKCKTCGLYHLGHR